MLNDLGLSLSIYSMWSRISHLYNADIRVVATNHQCLHEKHALAVVAGFLIALAASSFGWLGTLMYDRYVISAASGALIVCGYSLRSEFDTSSTLLFGSIVQAFGVGSLFSTTPAYMSVSKTPFIRSFALMTLMPMIGGVAMQ